MPSQHVYSDLFSDLFPNLYKKYPYLNFDALCEVVSTSFQDFFSLPILEGLAAKKEGGSYFTFFNHCIARTEYDPKQPETAKLLSPEHIFQVMVSNLNSEQTQDFIKKTQIFVPTQTGTKKPHLAFFEKFASGTLSTAEPLTYIDMVRIVNWFDNPSHIPLVRNLHHLSDKESTSPLLLLNVNENLEEMPKWVVIDQRSAENRTTTKAKNLPRDQSIFVYCEAMLKETEKKRLQEKLGRQLPDACFLGGNAAFAPSTGYLALAWLKEYVGNQYAFTLDSDFTSLLTELAYAVYPNRDTAYLAPRTMANEAASYHHADCIPYIPNGSRQLGGTYALISYLAWRTTTGGSIGSLIFPVNDLCQAAPLLSKASSEEKNMLRDRSERSAVRALDVALINHGSLKETDKACTLTLPEASDLSRYISAVEKQFEAIRINYSIPTPEWLNLYAYKDKKNKPRDEFAVACVLTLFRSRAKKHTFTIQLPESIQLDQDELSLLERVIENNAFLSEIENPLKNRSLENLQDRLRPQLARNRWLHHSGYLPPIIDDFWKRAAKYALDFFPNHLDLLTREAKDYALFKRCIREMGLKGLNALLDLLKDETQRMNIERVYGKTQPAFYAACEGADHSQYLDTLIQHIKSAQFFPFSELALHYEPGSIQPLLNFITEINRLNQFNQLQLCETLQDTHALESLLTTLIAQAEAESWTTLIVIPELAQKEQLTSSNLPLLKPYTLLNNIILNNRRELAARTELKTLEPFLQKAESGLMTQQIEGHHAKQERPHSDLTRQIQQLPEQTTWSLKRSGDVQLQLQQQQQIEQNRQVQKNQEKVLQTNYDEALSGRLVDYQNIDQLLGPFLREKMAEGTLALESLRQAMTLHGERKTPLQDLFHTWINANPEVGASEVIQKISLDAAKILLEKHRHFTAGLNLYNLPRGFYTQRSKDGLLILCYNPELGFVTQPNEFTPDLRTLAPRAMDWEGDFRQFQPERYKQVSPLEGNELAWSDILLYAALQPQPIIKDEEVQVFLKSNRINLSLCETDLERIKNNWVSFTQAWQYDNENGIRIFLHKSASAFRLTPSDIQTKLFSQQSSDLTNWAQSQAFNLIHLKGLGQVYYRYGHHGLMLFLTLLKNLEQNLGAEFFNVLKETIFQSTDNFASYLSADFFDTVNQIIEKLKPTKQAAQKQLFQSVLLHHTHSCGWEHLTKLWDAFSSFIDGIQEMGVELSGFELKEIISQNMLVFLERLLKSTQQLPQLDQKQRLLKDLVTFDLSHGGVHYAIQQEGFKYLNEERLHLSQFQDGTPTYGPDLTHIFDARDQRLQLQIQRTLASKVQFSYETYKQLSSTLGRQESDVQKLMWLLHTQYEPHHIDRVLEQLSLVNSGYLNIIARALHTAVYIKKHAYIHINLNALFELEKNNRTNLETVLRLHPDASFLEGISILFQSRQYNFSSVNRLYELFTQTSPEQAHASTGLKCAALFGVNSEELKQFFTALPNSIPVVDHEIIRLARQLFSIDYEKSNCENLKKPSNWTGLITCLNLMKQHPKDASKHRIAYLNALTQEGLKFKYSKNGDFRALRKALIDQASALSLFIDHSDRIKAFLTQHIAVASSANDEEVITPIVRFLTRMQLNRTYLNEIEPLLASLETAAQGHYWHIDYFVGLLKALQPKDDQVAFPISILKALLKEESIEPKELDHIEERFPEDLQLALQQIINGSVFNREQQTLLCQIALRDLRWNNNTEQVSFLLALLSREQLSPVRTPILQILANAKETTTFKARVLHCRYLLEQNISDPDIQKHWYSTAKLWLQSAIETVEITQLFDELYNKYSSDPKFIYLSHILAWSTLNKQLKTDEEQSRDLIRKSQKLFERLAKLDIAILKAMGQHFPATPSPTGSDLLHILKNYSADQVQEALNQFKLQPFTESRPDFACVAATREKDLQRMISETVVTKNNTDHSFKIKQSSRLILIFGALKQLEEGRSFLEGETLPLSKLSPDALRNAFTKLNDLAIKKPNDDHLRIQIWAVLFEVLGRTTRKYPHLAQQFAIIANDIGIEATSRVLQLATGEGKSHYVALRAAKHAGLGRTIDVCTAKRTLAQRDLLDYESFFNYLGLRTAYIHPKSSKEAYESAQIHYSTAGDLSLFIDAHRYQNDPVMLGDITSRIALFDEFDFIRFEEGTKTQYNFAIPTGKTPKQMTWFYQAVNAFQEQMVGKTEKITKKLLLEFVTFLHQQADKNEDKENDVHQLAQDPTHLVRWLQASCEAAALEHKVNYTISEELIEVGEEVYPLREIIPLSSDNQKVEGSTFSGGVHQLLAAKLNQKAKLNNEPQNFHIHPESEILSTRVVAELMKSLWGTWEGFSGTISALQVDILTKTHGTEVLQVPTNSSTLRQWHTPAFFDNADDMLKGMVEKIRFCLKNKQSILFACKDDKQVDWLKRVLTDSNQPLLTQAEIASFIFYTNESKDLPKKVIDEDKKALEKWHGGKKNQGVGLVASGFGRGDNVGVEAVFLLHANGHNDLVQKGGRTARNGEAGSVYQFYVKTDLRKEHKLMLDALQKMLTAEQWQGFINTFSQLFLHLNEEEKILQELLTLREYIHALQNTSTEHVHYLRSQLSDWGMQYLSRIEDVEKRQELIQSFRSHMKHIEKKWVEIDSQNEPTLEKIAKIKQFIDERSEDFRHQDPSRTLSPFTPEKHELLVPTLVLRPKDEIEKNERSSSNTIHFCLSQLVSTTNCSIFLNLKISERLERIARKKQLSVFASRLDSVITLDGFEHELQVLEQQLDHPSQITQDMLNSGDPIITPQTLLDSLQATTRLRLIELLNGFEPRLQEELMIYFTQVKKSKIEDRVQTLIPFMIYLKRFTHRDHQSLRMDYIKNISMYVYLANKQPFVKLLMQSTMPVLSANHFLALTALSSKLVVETDERIDLFNRFVEFTREDTEQRIRILTKAEAFLGCGQENDLRLILDMSECMQHFVKGENWDQFERLMKLTQERWNNQPDQNYPARRPLINMWSKLNQLAKRIPLSQVHTYLDYCLNKPGKLGVELLALTLDIPLPLQAPWIYFIEQLEEKTKKKHMQLKYLSQWCELLAKEPRFCTEYLTLFYEMKSALQQNKQQAWEECNYTFILSQLQRPRVQVEFLAFMRSSLLQQLPVLEFDALMEWIQTQLLERGLDDSMILLLSNHLPKLASLLAILPRHSEFHESMLIAMRALSELPTLDPELIFNRLDEKQLRTLKSFQLDAYIQRGVSSIQVLVNFMTSHPQEHHSLPQQRKLLASHCGTALRTFERDVDKKEKWISIIYQLLEMGLLRNLEVDFRFWTQKINVALPLIAKLDYSNFNRLTEWMETHPEMLVRLPQLILTLIPLLKLNISWAHKDKIQTLFIEVGKAFFSNQGLLLDGFLKEMSDEAWQNAELTNELLDLLTKEVVMLMRYPKLIQSIRAAFHPRSPLYQARAPYVRLLLDAAQLLERGLDDSMILLLSNHLPKLASLLAILPQHSEFHEGMLIAMRALSELPTLDPELIFNRLDEKQLRTLKGFQLVAYIQKGVSSIQVLVNFMTSHPQEHHSLPQQRKLLASHCGTALRTFEGDVDKKEKWISIIYQLLEMGLLRNLEVDFLFWTQKINVALPLIAKLDYSNFNRLTEWMETHPEMLVRLPQLILTLIPLLKLNISWAHKDKIQTLFIEVGKAFFSNQGLLLDGFLKEMSDEAWQNAELTNELLDLLTKEVVMLMRYPKLIQSIRAAFHPRSPLYQARTPYVRLLLDAAQLHLNTPELKVRTLFDDFLKTMDKLDPVHFDILSRTIRAESAFYIQNPDRLQHLLTALKAKKSALERLQPTEFATWLNAIHHNKQQLLDPEILELICQFSGNVLLISALTWSLTYVERHPLLTRAELLTQVRFFFQNHDALSQNELITSFQEFNVIEVLFDKSTSYFASERTQNKNNSTASLFYSLMKKHQGDDIQVAANPLVQQLFNFDDQSVRQARLQWMHALHHEVFIQRPGTPVLSIHWNKTKNDALLESGFKAYLQEAQRILNNKPKKKDIHRNTDLSQLQRVKLFNLSQELSKIVEPIVPNAQVSHPSLSQGLEKLMKQYDGAWWVSAQRKEQAKALRQDLSGLFAGAPNYSNIYHAIHKIKCRAMAEDLKANAQRSFMTNRSGESRLFNTLNQMQDLVLSTWVQDKQASFKDYATMLETEYDEHLKAFKDELDRSVKDLPNQTYRFFLSNQSSHVMQNLHNVLPGLDQKSTLKQINASLPNLPGHLSTLAREVLNRGLALKEGQKMNAGI